MQEQYLSPLERFLYGLSFPGPASTPTYSPEDPVKVKRRKAARAHNNTARRSRRINRRK